MAQGVNKVILLGNLGNDPDVRYTQAGMAIANVSIATSEAWKDKVSGEKQEKTEWHKVVFFGRQAEIVKQYLHKGSKIYVEGSLATNKWQDKDNVERYTTQIKAQVMQMLDGKSDNNQGGGYTGGGSQAAGQGTQTPPPAYTSSDAPPPAAGFDQDVPF